MCVSIAAATPRPERPPGQIGYEPVGRQLLTNAVAAAAPLLSMTLFDSTGLGT